MKHIGMFRATLLALAAVFSGGYAFAEETQVEDTPEVEETPAVTKVKWLKPKYTSTMTVEGYSGATELENFPIAVRISTANIPGFDYSKCDGEGDITFTDNEGNILPHEVEVWNTEGESVAWVSIPKLATVVADDKTTYTTFKMHWGHDTKLADSKAQEVWTAADYSAVWHMNLNDGSVENSAGSSLSFNNSLCSVATTSKIGGALMLAPGKTECGNIFSALKPFSSGVNSGAYISGWGYFKGYSSTSNTEHKYVVYFYASGTRYFRLRIKSGNLCYNYRTSTTAFSPTKSATAGWFHWAINLKPGSKATSNWTHDWWINGEKLYTVSKEYDFLSAATTMTLRSGGTADSTDECRVRNSAVSDDWIKAEYDSINNKQFVVASETIKNGYGLKIIVR